MKISSFTAYFIILIILSIVTTSCIDVERKIKLNKDGSGTEKMTMLVSKDFFDFFKSFTGLMDKEKAKIYMDSLYSDEHYKRSFENTYKKTEGMKLLHVESKTNEDSSKTIYAEGSFENVKYLGSSLKFNALDTNNAFDDSAEISFKEEGNKVIFKFYTYPKESSTSPYKDFIVKYFQNRKLVFDIDFPYDVVSSNATFSNGRNQMWEFDLESMIENPVGIKLDAVMKK